jgi:NitT/TauT family transport system substrate-binding protein
VLTAGLVRGVHRLLATLEEMHSEAQTLYLMYNVAAIQQLGAKVGERFMVAYLRGVRDYINAFEYGLDQEAIINILSDYTVLKDPDVFRQIKYNWIDPNGAVNWATLQADADLFYELGLLRERVDLSGTFEDQYRQVAVQYLGQYQPPQ